MFEFVIKKIKDMAKKATSKKKETPKSEEEEKPKARNIAQEKIAEIQQNKEERVPHPLLVEDKTMTKQLVCTFVKEEDRAFFYEFDNFYLRVHEKIDVDATDTDNTGSKYEKPYFNLVKIMTQMKEEGYITIGQHIKNTLILKTTQP